MARSKMCAGERPIPDSGRTSRAPGPPARFLVVGGILRGPGTRLIHAPIERAERRRDQDRVVDRP